MRPCLRPFAVLILAASPALATPPQYQVTVVDPAFSPAPSGPISMPLALNNNGRVVGYSYTDGNNFRTLNWKDGVPTAVSGVSSYDRTFGNQVNILGRVVGGGYRLDANGGIVESHALKWTGGVMSDLGTLGGRNAVALSINDSEQIVGFSSTSGEATEQAFIYQNGRMSALPSLTGAVETLAYDISNTGYIAGTAVTNTPAMPVLWHNARPQQLPIPPSRRTGAANAVNNAGIAVGTYELSQYTGSFAAAEWINGQVLNLGNLGGAMAYATAKDINSIGQVVGTSLAPDGMAGFIFQNGHMFDLNNYLVSGFEALRITGAGAINDRGQIVATALIDGRQTAVILSPIVSGVPGPASLSLLAAAGLIVTRRRRSPRRG